MVVFDDFTSSLVESLIDTTHTVHRSCNLAQENGLKQSGTRKEFQSIVKPSSSWHDLTSTSVDSISVKFAISDIEPHSSHMLFTKSSLSGGPLEGR